MVPHPTSREALSSGVTRPGSHSETGPHLTPARQPAAVQGRADPVWASVPGWPSCLHHLIARSPTFLGISLYPWLHCCPGSRRGPKFVGSFIHSQLSSEGVM